MLGQHFQIQLSNEIILAGKPQRYFGLDERSRSGVSFNDFLYKFAWESDGPTMTRLLILLLSLLFISTVKADCEVCPVDTPYLISVPNSPASSPNGCGPALISGIVPNFDFKTCCDQHDICYGSCNSTKTLCDNTFHSCMKNVCVAKEENSDSFCAGVADLYFEALNNKLSCSIYKSSILKRCQCQATVRNSLPCFLNFTHHP
ncbi:hypothetical protein K493DRAFT_109986 [Basidiobolus meristosporus CBS 931.73]|uniref:Phospholipase A2 domain-containing protein n=1 Tax=Basidiobolus meristosporus CBS 931.73 TaxID=1314790 RepID=A0A1Y1YPD3_9FUNG|nr:hypothetical protein K493DRAFT_109986 [Basidiobolus meristosporus CBS 931.73]|eukprot:ORX99444.1 hypothetical protein K493DRAFT_109986 [Basidiobolus meristosporus CBS 931.73]